MINTRHSENPATSDCIVVLLKVEIASPIPTIAKANMVIKVKIAKIFPRIGISK